MAWQPSSEMTVPQFGPVVGQQISLPVSAVPPVMSPAKPMPSAVSGPRAAGSVAPVRLPPAARLEYEAYIQSRMRAMTPQGVPPAGVPMSAVGVPAQGTLHTTIAPGVIQFAFWVVLYLLVTVRCGWQDMCQEKLKEEKIKLKKNAVQSAGIEYGVEVLK